MSKSINKKLSETLTKLFITFIDLCDDDNSFTSNRVDISSKEYDGVIIKTFYGLNKNPIHYHGGWDYVLQKSREVILNTPHFYSSSNRFSVNTNNHVSLCEFQIGFYNNSEQFGLDSMTNISIEMAIESIEAMKTIILEMQKNINKANDVMKGCKDFFELKYERELLIEKTMVVNNF